jgi:DNA transposition AAA+ family ATPase
MSEPHEQSNETETTGDEKLRDWLAEHIDNHPHRTTAILSRAEHIGISRRALDDYLAGRYFLPKEEGGQGINPVESKIENAIRTYRHRVEGTPRHGYANGFTLTRTWERLQEACSIAVNENSIVLVYGRPGIGKTRCLMEFVLREMGTVPVSIMCSRNITPLYFVERLARELKIPKSGKIAEIEDRIVEALIRLPRPIIADQANYLSEKSLGSLCYIWEKACVPVIMSGTKELINLFTTSRLTESVRAQLSSRVSWHYLLPELSVGETKALVGVALGSKATDEVVAQIHNLTGGVYRHVDMLIPRILDLKERHWEKLEAGDVSMKDIIATASSRLIIG